MSRTARVILAIAAAGCSGCFPLITPPLSLEGGATTRIGDGPKYRLGAGVHAASAVADRELPFDVGAGYIATGPFTSGEKPVSHGAYVQGGPRIAGGRTWRAFAEGRAEYYFAPRAPDIAYAGLVRLSVEAFVPVSFEPVSSESSDGSFYIGLAYGSLAIGPYVEGGYQRLVLDAGLPVLSAGLHIRVPATFGLVCCAWDFKKK
jgi:hypothetical protein